MSVRHLRATTNGTTFNLDVDTDRVHLRAEADADALATDAKPRDVRTRDTKAADAQATTDVRAATDGQAAPDARATTDVQAAADARAATDGQAAPDAQAAPNARAAPDARAATDAQTRDTRAAGGRTFLISPVDSDVLRIAPDGADGAPLRAHVVANGDTTWVFIDGETFTIDVAPADQARPRRRASGNEGLAAPMPATVIKVLVEPGAEVHRGDVLLLLEAMKMELPVRAPRDGRVKALHCRPGELVQPGTALVDLE
jgi:acetyl/propionyl-CoA carboxylase alpha subunit